MTSTQPSILIVEDEQIVSLDIKGMLERAGYRVLATAASGEEALDILASKRPDLAVIDIKLDGRLDGIETAAAIRKSHDIPLLFMTAYTDRETRKRADAVEPQGYLTKPIDMHRLQTIIDKTLAHAARRR
jgi:CheY-like chemotaxis protein